MRRIPSWEEVLSKPGKGWLIFICACEGGGASEQGQE